MISAPLPDNEEDRLEALKNYKILDTLPEQDFDDLTYIASTICETPIALISLVDDHRQWFKSRVGLDVPETPKDIAFCSHAILDDDLFVINDSFKDERFHDNPLATDAPHVRFYAGAPLITPNGEKIGTLCVIDDHPRDLTSTQRQTLMALSRQVMNQIELRHAKRIADSSAQAKSLFLANMSHEIRTPMNAVISCTHLLMDKITDDEDRQLLTMIDNAGDTLLRLINDILDFSKIEYGKIILEHKAFNLYDAVIDVIKLLRIRAEELKVEIELVIDERSPEWVIGDVTRLRQILVNIIGNAIKFTKDNVTVNISLHNDKKNPNIVLFTVQDNGIGMSDDDQNKIFNNFTQIDASITRKYGGTGLGLCICRGLSQAMQGEIWVKSKLNKGSTFFVTLELEKTTEQQQMEQVPLSKINPSMGKNIPLKILLAEDDLVNQIIIKQMFGKLGYDIDVVSDGMEAVDLLSKSDYDFIFMDMQMPRLDGIGATKTIRKNGRRQPVIIALTANAFSEDKEACFDAGMEGFITKPVDLQEVVSELSKNSKYTKNI